MELNELCRGLSLPEAVTARVLAVSERAPRDLLARMLRPDTWEAAVDELKKTLGPDPDGMKLLAVQLRVCLDVWERYRARGIPAEIFWATMGFVTRFVEDYNRQHGHYAYVWGWWFPRQLSMNEYRIGPLEYELSHGETPRIQIHIPADADLTPAAVDRSIADARAFLRAFEPRWAAVPMHCESWMVSPALEQLLDEGSRVLAFSRRFRVESVDWESLSVCDWVYPGYDPEFLTELPEKTTLQKRMKQYLLAGGKVGWAKGVLQE